MDDGGGGGGGGGGSAPSGPPGSLSKGARTISALENKKINEYFPKHHVGSSPIRHGGAKSPSPQLGYPMVTKKDDNFILFFKIKMNYLFINDL